MAMKKKASVKKNRDKGNAEQELDEPQANKAELADQLTEEEQEEKDGAEPADSQTVEVTSLSPEEMQKLVQEKEQQYDRLLRLQADFENYRKRIQKEQANLIRYGAENALREILPVIDNVERAVESVRKHDDSNSQLREGIELILSQFLNALEKLGVQPIEAVGQPFDPNKHDALLRVHAPDSMEGLVVEEVRKGYYLHDKVLRPAQVTVGTSQPVQDSGPTSEEGT